MKLDDTGNFLAQFHGVVGSSIPWIHLLDVS